MLGFFWIFEVNCVDFEKCKILFVFFGVVDLIFDCIVGLEWKVLDLWGWDINIVGVWEVVGVGWL